MITETTGGLGNQAVIMSDQGRVAMVDLDLLKKEPQHDQVPGERGKATGLCHPSPFFYVHCLLFLYYQLKYFVEFGIGENIVLQIKPTTDIKIVIIVK